MSVIVFAFFASAGAQAGQSSDGENSHLEHLPSDIYSEGPLEVKLFSVDSYAVSGLGTRKSNRGDGASELKTRGGGVSEARLASQPPRPLLIATPREAGRYPVVVLQHAFTMKNSFYTELLKHVASHGFIVVAPQMYWIAGSDATDEICLAASVIDWFSLGLPEVLLKRVPSVEADLEKLALVGHSRGGKVVFGLATGVCKTSLKFSAIAGLDPVDGMGIHQQTNPPILQFFPHSLNLGFPTLIVGAALGSSRRNFLFPPCAPEGVSHEAFFCESGAPSFHFVASEYGHMDYLDEDTGGLQGLVSYCVCKNGPAREPMRRFSSGILVAFLRASLLGDGSQLYAAILNPSEAPVQLDPPGTYGNLTTLSNMLSATY